MNYLGGIVIPTFTLKQRPKTIAQMTYQHICICINVYIYIYIYIYMNYALNKKYNFLIDIHVSKQGKNENLLSVLWKVYCLQKEEFGL